MDTRVMIILFSEREEANVLAGFGNAFQVFAQLESQFSLYRDDSELVSLNKNAGTKMKVSPLMFQVIEDAVKMAYETHGIFNPLVGCYTAPLVGKFSDVIDYSIIELDSSQQTVKIPIATALDLNSVVKGLALDLAVKCFPGNEKVMIEAGGDIRVLGDVLGNSGWKVGIRNPADPTKIVTVLELSEGAICTSGNYFRGEKAQEKGRLHLVAPKFLAKNSVKSMTVIAPTAQEADILSTAAFLMPIVQAIEFVEKHFRASCLIIDAEELIYMSPRMQNYFNTSTSLCLN